MKMIRCETKWKKSPKGKAELQRQISKLNAEIQQWKAKYENEGLTKVDEIEDAKPKLMQKVQEMQEQLDGANSKNALLEKMRHKLMGDLDDAQVDVERAKPKQLWKQKKSKYCEPKLKCHKSDKKLRNEFMRKKEEFEILKKIIKEHWIPFRQTRSSSKLESDINELKIALDHANKANADAQKNIHKYKDQIRELQMQAEGEQRQRNELQDQYTTSEKRCAILQSEKECCDAVMLLMNFQHKVNLSMP